MHFEKREETMEKTEIKLECLKLAVKPGVGLEGILASAKVYEDYVFGPKDLKSESDKDGVNASSEKNKTLKTKT